MGHTIHKLTLPLPGSCQTLLQVVDRDGNPFQFLRLAGWIEQMLTEVVGLKQLQLLIELSSGQAKSLCLAADISFQHLLDLVLEDLYCHARCTRPRMSLQT